ncbi:MAG: hypothetical protein LBG47_01075 [Prevotellaceae bacterium]|nr:hypothetical protein [Prevotellaceae bacterium]
MPLAPFGFHLAVGALAFGLPLPDIRRHRGDFHPFRSMPMPGDAQKIRLAAEPDF